MWVYFDTFHVNQQPTYMSKYPPGQGAFLALGEILGNPWIGVVISIALMCGAIVWMLQGWLPPEWALLGGALAVLRLGIFSYWMNSYWGGAVAAIGGALVVGALPRVVHLRRARDACLMGVGVALLANSRPFEGFVFSLPVCVALVAWLFSRRRPAWGIIARRAILPVCAVLAITAVFMGYYDWRGTGHPLLVPYVVNTRAYMSQPDFVWQEFKAPLQYRNPQFESFYNGWAREAALEGKVNSVRKGFRILRSDIRVFVRFFLWPELCVPLLAVPWILMDRRVRFLVVQSAFFFLALLASVWFQPHYTAPIVATTFALVIQGMRHMRRWHWRTRRVGIGLSRAVVLCAVILAPFHWAYTNLLPQLRYRAIFSERLGALPGDHLAIVRYSSDHEPHSEWVYNRADIDDAKIVWAREIPGVSMQPLLNYFRGRDVWLVTADTSPPQLSHYSRPH